MADLGRRAWRPVACYLLFAGAWIFLSTPALDLLTPSATWRSNVEILKGFGFVLVTSLLLYRLILGELRRLDAVRRHTEELKSVLQTLTEVNQLIVRERNPDQLFQGICDILVKNRNYPLAWVGLLDEKTRRVVPVASAGTGESFLREITATWGDNATIGLGPVGRAAGTGAPVILNENTQDADYAPWLEKVQRHGYAASAAFPLRNPDGTYGILSVYSAHADAFSPDEVALLGEMTDDVDFAVRNSREEQKRQEAEDLVRLQAERLEDLARRDPVTGLYNRLHFGKLLGQACQSGQNPTGFSLLGFALIRFPEVNAVHGYGMGDQVLTAVGERLRRNLADDWVAARIGGFRFAILLPATGPEKALAQATSLLDDLTRQPLAAEGLTFPLSARGGVVSCPAHGVTRTELESALELAITQAVQRNDGVPLFLEPDIFSAYRTSWDRFDLVRRAAGGKLFVPVFQPLVHLADGRVCGYEVLARIREGDTLLEAAGFIREVEEFGYLPLLDRLIMDAVVEQENHPVISGKLLFFNQPPHLLADESVRNRLQTTLTAFPDLASRTVLELTELGILPKSAAVESFLRRMRDLGVRLALDDFGGGYSSLTYFHRLPIDYVKIDISLIRDLTRNPLSRRLVASIHRLAQDFGALTLGEGIEDGETAAVLRDIGVQLGQGYHLGRPTPLANLVWRVRSENLVAGN